MTVPPEHHKPYWFKRRRYGYGWAPAKWQGWVALAVYCTLVIVLALVLIPGDTVTTMVYYLAGVAAFTIALLWLGLTKGPKPRWRWGRRSDDNPDEDF